MDDVKIKVIDSDKLINAIKEGSYDVNLSAVMALGAVMLDTKNQEICAYCHEDSDGYVMPIEKNSHAFIRFGMDGWELSLNAKGWHGGAKIKYCPMCGRELKNAIKQLPFVKPQEQKTGWIPVSELPRENGWYQCTVIVNDLPRTMELFYKNDKWLDNRRIDMFNTYDIYGYGYIEEKHKLSYQELISEFDWTKYVIAWMPLPEPYKAESEGEL